MKIENPDGAKNERDKDNYKDEHRTEKGTGTEVEEQRERGRDGTGRDGTGRDGTGRDGTGQGRVGLVSRSETVILGPALGHLRPGRRSLTTFR